MGLANILKSIINFVVGFLTRKVKQPYVPPPPPPLVRNNYLLIGLYTLLAVTCPVIVFIIYWYTTKVFYIEEHEEKEEEETSKRVPLSRTSSGPEEVQSKRIETPKKEIGYAEEKLLKAFDYRVMLSNIEKAETSSHDQSEFTSSDTQLFENELVRLVSDVPEDGVNLKSIITEWNSLQKEVEQCWPATNDLLVVPMEQPAKSKVQEDPANVLLWEPEVNGVLPKVYETSPPEGACRVCPPQEQEVSVDGAKDTRTQCLHLLTVPMLPVQTRSSYQIQSCTVRSSGSSLGSRGVSSSEPEPVKDEEPESKHQHQQTRSREPASTGFQTTSEQEEEGKPESLNVGKLELVEGKAENVEPQISSCAPYEGTYGMEKPKTPHRVTFTSPDAEETPSQGGDNTRTGGGETSNDLKLDSGPTKRLSGRQSRIDQFEDVTNSPKLGKSRLSERTKLEILSKDKSPAKRDQIKSVNKVPKSDFRQRFVSSKSPSPISPNRGVRVVSPRPDQNVTERSRSKLGDNDREGQSPAKTASQSRKSPAYRVARRKTSKSPSVIGSNSSFKTKPAFRTRPGRLSPNPVVAGENAETRSDSSGDSDGGTTVSKRAQSKSPSPSQQIRGRQRASPGLTPFTSKAGPCRVTSDLATYKKAAARIAPNPNRVVEPPVIARRRKSRTRSDSSVESDDGTTGRAAGGSFSQRPQRTLGGKQSTNPAFTRYANAAGNKELQSRGLRSPARAQDRTESRSPVPLRTEKGKTIGSPYSRSPIVVNRPKSQSGETAQVAEIYRENKSMGLKKSAKSSSPAKTRLKTSEQPRSLGKEKFGFWKQLEMTVVDSGKDEVRYLMPANRKRPMPDDDEVSVPSNKQSSTQVRLRRNRTKVARKYDLETPESEFVYETFE